MKPQTGKSFPAITLPTLSGKDVTLGKASGDNWALVLVYRGAHCPLCRLQLKAMQKHVAAFTEAGVEITVVSGDPEEKARNFHSDIKLDAEVAYGLSIAQMKELGLYISEPRSAAETDRPYAEPGLFVVNDEGILHLADISNAPFSRPDMGAIAGGVKYIRENNYPIRGDYQG
ncbi:peroxiredoxin-like family protein [Halocynthiibacter styelae]|uniref:AhpC/TSA family protein n=1 Tax=Halocynthiibacter styelae TaxID=2761955 RepID=A0A8J7LPH7_9RHOB|nr:peroxiredoxin-like family protein [Paenihalocynthiibacter styelae]MBI1493601.1 AhpC/TSA family protein [Paenihalocynthiibacter styelae]